MACMMRLCAGGPQRQPARNRLCWWNLGRRSTASDPNAPDGPERFRDAFRHIVDICKDQCATNITWFFHVNAYNVPEAQWNTIAQYYPGDSYIDWLGVSIYGPQTSEEPYQEFCEILDDVYPQLTAIADKPIAVLEFAITEL